MMKPFLPFSLWFLLWLVFISKCHVLQYIMGSRNHDNFADVIYYNNIIMIEFDVSEHRTKMMLYFKLFVLGIFKKVVITQKSMHFSWPKFEHRNSATPSSPEGRRRYVVDLLTKSIFACRNFLKNWGM